MAAERRTVADRIVVAPQVMTGKPIIEGTRIPVELVLKRLAQDLDMTAIFDSYPHLTPADIKVCLAYAHVLVEGEERFPAQAPIPRAG